MFKTTLCFLLISVSGYCQNIQFSDPDLLFYLTTKLCVDTNGDGVFDSDADFNNDGQIQFSEAQQVTSFAFTTVAHGIQNIGGFEHFTNLQHLEVTTISVSHMDFSVWPSLQSLKLSSLINSFVFDNPLLTHFTLQNVANSNPLFDLTNLPNLEYVKIQSNGLVDNLIFGTHNNLEELIIAAGEYSVLNLSGMPALKSLIVSKFTGSTIDISNCTLLEEFTFRYQSNLSQIIGSSASTNLQKIDFIQDDYNTIPSNLNVTFNNQAIDDLTIRGAHSVSLSNNNTEIGRVELYFVDGPITISNCEFSYLSSGLNAMLNIASANTDDITLTDLHGLAFLQFESLQQSLPLDLSIVETTSISFSNCTITELNLKNGFPLNNFYSSEDTSIEFICVDRDELEIVQNGYLNTDSPVVIHPYCTFVLGGEYYEILGNIMMELGTGCSPATNGPIFDLQYTITDGINTDIFYGNELNSYSYTLPEGNHLLTTQLNGLNYWTVTPSSIDLNFPADGSPYTQDFCITPNGNFNDVEITIIPINAAQPGFQAIYKLIYKNIGTTTLSSNINLSFNDDFMDFVLASPTLNTQTIGNLTWDYTNLLPFETREISFTMMLNSPTHPSFPLNANDVLTYTALINPLASDETANNNTFTLNQVAVNSLDPNEIRCLQGNTVTPQYVGDYVHYIIRFENNGTSNASNVVVKDVLDTNKFDIASLIPLHGSHNFYTRIVKGNEVEFIFENIQLPFVDTTNDGYVLFKIKTLPSLVIGDTFDNQAEIYFDFNFPIITNTETTLIDENLLIAESTVHKIKIFPNPVKNILTVNSKTKISSISVYDLNGRLLNTEHPSSNILEYQLDVKSLSNGIYFLQVESDFTKQIVKFIKN